MIIWKRPCWKNKYIAKDLEAGRQGDGKIPSARGLDIPQVRLADKHRIAFYTELPRMPLRLRDHSFKPISEW